MLKEVRLASIALWQLTRTDDEHPSLAPGLKVLHHLKPHTRTLDLSHNTLLGSDGLRQILLELCRSEGQEEIDLEVLTLVNCGLGGPGTSPLHFPLPLSDQSQSLNSPGPHYSTESLEILAHYLPLLPNLCELLLTNNDLTVLPTSFISALLTHPRLRLLSLSTNAHLGTVPEGQLHSPLFHLLSAYHAHALTPTAGPDWNLRVLRLDQTSLSGEEVGEILLRIILLNERGLEELTVNGNESLQTAVLDTLRWAIDPSTIPSSAAFSSLDPRTLPKKEGNRFIVRFETRGSDDDIWVQIVNPFQQALPTTTGVPLVQRMPRPRLDISSRLHENRLERSLTRDAALGLLKAGRILLLALPPDDNTPSSSSAAWLTESNAFSGPFRILDVPTEIVSAILSAVVDASALSQRQIAAVLAFARDRSTLVASTDRQGGEREKEAFLRKVGCWWFEV